MPKKRVTSRKLPLAVVPAANRRSSGASCAPSMPAGADETRVHPALKEYFGYCLAKLAVRLKKYTTAALVNETVCGYQIGVLTVLSKLEDSNQLALGEELGIDKASMVKLIDALEKEGLVEREAHATDRRQKIIRLTRKGLDSLARLRKVAKGIETELLSALPVEDQSTVRRSVPILLEHLMRLEEKTPKRD